MRKISLLLFSVLLAILLFGLVPGPAAGLEFFENEDARAEWQTSISKEKVIRGEQFYATLDLTATIRKIPGGAYGAMISLVNKLPTNATFSYDVFGKKDAASKELPLGSYKMSKSLPELKEGAKFEFPNEKIPSEGYLVFPKDAGFGRYTLYVRFTRIEANASFIHKDITGMIRDYLPPQTFDSGIRLAEIELIEPPLPELTTPMVIAASPGNGFRGVSVGSNISITFNEPVDRASAEESFSVSPAVSGKFGWEGNVMTFTPKKKLSHGTIYRVAVGTSFRDLTNTAPAAEFSAEFSTKSKPSRWWIWPIVGAAVIAGLFVYFLLIRKRRRAMAGS
ncbi:MAG: Ig-like domain-containing protein [Dehalococcoidia bacterium]|nr:Ig-like domain-containing protein [Dehalococcoidia bacterium]